MAADRQRPDFLAVGHVTVDIVPTATNPAGERRYGGAVAYSALTAAALGLTPAVVTSADESYPLREVMPGVATHNAGSPQTTTFQNVYRSNRRSQILAARGGEIDLQDIPEHWRSPRIALLGPLAREFNIGACSWFGESITGLVLQGLLRRWDEYGRVSEEAIPPPAGGNKLAAVVASSDEISQADAEGWAPVSDVVVRTVSEEGALALIDGRWHHFEAPKVIECDPTGAGDVWMAAYLVRLEESEDPFLAANFATVAASLSVTGVGLGGIPTRDAIESVLTSRQ